MENFSALGIERLGEVGRYRMGRNKNLECNGRESNSGLPRGRREFYH